MLEGEVSSRAGATNPALESDYEESYEAASVCWPKGTPSRELLELIRDFGLGILMIGTVWRGADLAWFWPVHYVLDMTQFLGRTS